MARRPRVRPRRPSPSGRPHADRTALARRTARPAVIGLGYVGLPLAVEFAQAGFTVAGIDVDAAKVARAQRGRSLHPGRPATRRAPRWSRPGASSADDRLLASCAKRRHGQHLRADAAAQDARTRTSRTSSPPSSEIAQHLHPGMLVILESTTYPGTTDELILPDARARRGCKVGQGLLPRLLARARRSGQPASTRRGTSPRSSAASRPRCTEVARALYRQALEHGRAGLARPRVAEMVKLLENTFRSVNIGLVNETGADVRPDGHRRLGGHRRGGHQAVRLHAVLSRARAWAGTASRSTRSTCPGRRKAVGLRGALHRAGRPDQRPACPSTSCDRVAEALNERSQARCSGSRVLVLGRGLQGGHRRHARVARARHHRAARGEGAKVDYSDPFVPRHRLRRTRRARASR